MLCEGMAEATSNVLVVGKRSTNKCVYCCNIDLCNGSCSYFVNLVLHKSAYQCSVHAGGAADRAVDGDTTKNYFTGQSCMHTDREHYTWWAVDLGHEFHVTNAIQHNRDDADDGRSIHLKVEISNVSATLLPKDSPLFQTCGAYVGHSFDGNTKTIDCPRTKVGRWHFVKSLKQDIHRVRTMFRSVKLYVFILCNVVALNAQKVTGPICFACDRTDNPEDCRSSTTCESEMACSVQEIIAPHGVVYFWSGCESYD
ncbi:hypothetical protein DPMN_064454, partial [Dreissena polymorpha]